MAKYAVGTTVPAGIYGSLDGDGIAGFEELMTAMLRDQVTGQGFEVTGPVTIDWLQFTQRDYDLMVTGLLEDALDGHWPGALQPGWRPGDWAVRARAETSKP
jgi:hypothetical protein